MVFSIFLLKKRVVIHFLTWKNRKWCHVIWILSFGEMAEWSKAAVSKTVNGFTRSGVRIPFSPPSFFIPISTEKSISIWLGLVVNYTSFILEIREADTFFLELFTILKVICQLNQSWWSYYFCILSWKNIYMCYIVYYLFCIDSFMTLQRFI